MPEPIPIATERQNEWVSVRKLLPRPWKYVQTYHRAWGVESAYMMTNGGWKCGHLVSHLVSHWMDLAEPPKSAKRGRKSYRAIYCGSEEE